MSSLSWDAGSAAGDEQESRGIYYEDGIGDELYDRIKIYL
jgi:hypothetical protein